MEVLDFVKTCIRRRKIFWSYHVNMRLKERFITREAIIFSVDTYKIIEEYPHDKYMPSCLICAQYEEQPLHIHVVPDFEADSVRIITSYRPSLEKWEADFKTRRKP